MRPLLSLSPVAIVQAVDATAVESEPNRPVPIADQRLVDAMAAYSWIAHHLGSGLWTHGWNTTGFDDGLAQAKRTVYRISG